MQIARAENISGEEEEMELNNHCTLESDGLKLPIVEVKLNNAGRSTWNAARRAAADQPLWKKYA